MGSEVPQEYTFIQLKNMGSTCFINAVLQSFYATDMVSNFCYQYDRLHKIYPRLQEMTCHTRLYLFVKIYIDSQNAPQNEVYYEPNYFLDSIFTPDCPFKRGEQNDSHEFILFLFNSSNNDVSNINKLVDANDQLPLFSKLFTGVLKKDSYSASGILIHSVQETFTYLTTFDPDLNAFIEKWKSGDNIHEATKKMTVKHEILEFPQILLIQSAVFKNSFQKAQLYLKPLFSINISGTCYYLRALIVHIGPSLNDGHYVCFYQINLRWVFADDDKMRPLNHEEYHKLFGEGYLPTYPTATPYILLYEKD